MRAVARKPLSRLLPITPPSVSLREPPPPLGENAAAYFPPSNSAKMR